ncbi:MAG: bifunctional metallophosphatase/5'-nucleotidase [Sphaerochaeta sp.]|jgi:2',3'-cyclic-nucleotide 2'-phosphodiesterase (5'-nucleotidase family)
MKRRIVFVFFLTLLTVFVGIGAQPVGEHVPDLVSLDVYSTNAFHGRLEAGGNPGAALLGSYIRHYREQNPHMIMVDAGNALQGTAVSTFFDGKPVIEFFNLAGYDALNIGNHEFDWKAGELKRIFADARAPYLGANIITRNGKPVDFAQPYTIIERDGVSVGIIGLIDPAHFDAIAASSLDNIAFVDAAAVAQFYSSLLREQGVDIIILLAMVPGMTDEHGTAKGNLIELARSVPQADAVIGSLHNNVAAIVDGKPVVLAWRYGEKLGHINLVFDRVSRKVVSSSVELIDVAGNPLGLKEDQAIAAMLASYVDILKEENSKPIGYVDQDLVRGSGETAIGNWIVDAMNESAGSQIAFTNPGGIRADLKAGEITGDAIYKICPFPNTIVTTRMDGALLLRFLEQCAEKRPIPISGLRFGFDRSLPVGSQVVFAELMDGTPILPDETYTVTTNSFLKDGKDGYTVLAENTDWVDSAVLMRDAMTQYVLRYKTIRTTLDGRIQDLTP